MVILKFDARSLSRSGATPSAGKQHALARLRRAGQVSKVVKFYSVFLAKPLRRKEIIFYFFNGHFEICRQSHSRDGAATQRKNY
jgi:hypothetical protein